MQFNSKVVLFLTVAIVLLACNTNKAVEMREHFIIQGDDSTLKAPDFELKNIDGQTIKLSDYNGKIVIIDFWATWCPPCREGIPDLIDLQKRYKDSLVVIGISVDNRNTINDVKPFAKYFGINYPVVYADNQVIMDYGWVQSYPTTFIIDPKGNVIRRYVGLYPKHIYEKEIKELLLKW